MTEPGCLELHALGEVAHLIGIIARGKHRLGEERQRPDGGLELMADVRNEVAPDRIDSALLGKIVDEHEDRTRSEGRDAHPELEQFASERWPSNAHLLLARLSVTRDLFDEAGDLRHRDEAPVDQTKRLAPGTSPKHQAIGTHDQ
ncbi:unannotated protein [freshwater metagenome]|uniref:Unannotated protein n=1 Tax=freshwater metagenome TaxID=449393 RepID=A0A6J7J0V6_9ZZZZ